MMMKRNGSYLVRAVATTALVAALVSPGISSPVSTDSSQPQSGRKDRAVDVDTATTGAFIRYKTANGSACRQATVEELASMRRRDPGQELHVITPERSERASFNGLTIILRATAQLEKFPDAKAAFLRAAAEWESLIANPITIIIDVDFGATRFGDPYGNNVLGSTDSQLVGGSGNYADIRTRLITSSSSDNEETLYNALPASTIPTDRGDVGFVVAASPAFRALGRLTAVANPTTEGLTLGPPPSIGFNSAFDFDFDPSNGVDINKSDFNAVVLHEIGHALGFNSFVGLQELDRDNPNIVSLIDLFRFRPGVTLGGFSTTQRVLTSGGTQSFFTGSGELALSTGRPNGTGGDGEQASHWKDDSQSGVFIGVMDPTIPDGTRFDLTQNDLLAFDLIGYRLTSTGPISITDAVGDLTGDTLTITGRATSTAGAIVTAQVALRDDTGKVISTQPETAVTPDPSGNFTIAVAGLNGLLSALRARFVLVDNAGNTSNVIGLDFSQADRGGPRITTTKLKPNGKLTLNGAGFNKQSLIEINGVTGPLPTGAKVNATGTKLKTTATALGLVSGVNRIRITTSDKRSNIILVTL